MSVSSSEFETRPHLDDINLEERTVLIWQHFSPIWTARRIEDKTRRRDCFKLNLDAEEVYVMARDTPD